MENKELFETVAKNIADILVNFEHYQSYEGETLEEHLQEFSYAWLDGTSEWVVYFRDEVLFDGFENEDQARNYYNDLENRIFEIAGELGFGI